MNRNLLGPQPLLSCVALMLCLGFHADQTLAEDGPTIPVQITTPPGTNVIRDNDQLDVGGTIFATDWPGIGVTKPTHIMIQIEIGGGTTPPRNSLIQKHPDTGNNDRLFPAIGIPSIPDGPATIIVTPVKEGSDGEYTEVSEPTRKDITIQTQRPNDPAPPINP